MNTDALKIIGTVILGSGLGFVGGIVYGLQDMTPERMFAPFIGAFIGGAVGVVMGSLVFA